MTWLFGNLGKSRKIPNNTYQYWQYQGRENPQVTGRIAVKKNIVTNP